MRYFIHLSYNGTNYSGWQWQTSTTQTIQQIITQVFRDFLKDQSLSINGCGRTDAGVHASQYFAHLDTTKQISQEDIYKINKRLPEDIVVFEVIQVDEKANARFDAIKRTYDFFIHTKDDPFLNPFSLLINQPKLDFMKMEESLLYIQNTSDFKKLCKNPDKHNSTLCKINDVNLYSNKDQSRIQFQITGNRFLKGMVRILMQSIIDIGTSKVDLAYFEQLLMGQATRIYKNTAHPQGLYLSSIEYPFLHIENKSNGFKILNLNHIKIQ